MQPLTVYLAANPTWPLRGFRDDKGNIRIGTPDGFDESRPLLATEIDRLEGDAEQSAHVSLGDSLPFP